VEGDDLSRATKNVKYDKRVEAQGEASRGDRSEKSKPQRDERKDDREIGKSAVLSPESWTNWVLSFRLSRSRKRGEAHGGTCPEPVEGNLLFQSDAHKGTVKGQDFSRAEKNTKNDKRAVEAQRFAN
jgi:hypothetical protein